MKARYNCDRLSAGVSFKEIGKYTVRVECTATSNIFRISNDRYNGEATI